MAGEEEKKADEGNAGTTQPTVGRTAATATATDGEDTPVDASLPGGADVRDSELRRVAPAPSPQQLPPTGRGNLDDRAVREIPDPPTPPRNFQLGCIVPWSASQDRPRPPLDSDATHAGAAAAAAVHNPAICEAPLTSAVAASSWNYGPPQPHQFDSQQHYEQFMSRYWYAHTGWPGPAVPVNLPLHGLPSSGPLRQGTGLVQRVDQISNQNGRRQAGQGSAADANAAASSRREHVGQGSGADAAGARQADMKRRKLTQQQQEELHLDQPSWAARPITTILTPYLQEMLRGIQVSSSWRPPPVPVGQPSRPAHSALRRDLELLDLLHPQPQQGDARRGVTSAAQEKLRLTKPSSAAQGAALQEELRLGQPSSSARRPPVLACQPAAAAPRTLQLLDPEPQRPIDTAPKCLVCEAMPMRPRGLPGSAKHLCVCEGCFNAGITRCPRCRDQPSSAAQATAFREELGLSLETTAGLQEMIRQDTGLQERFGLPPETGAFLQDELPRVGQPSPSVPRPPVRAGQPAAAASSSRTLELLDPKPQRSTDKFPKCWACNNRPASMASIPTMHLCVCEDCFDAGSTACPLCRGNRTPRG